jgi:hypothetical protein
MKNDIQFLIIGLLLGMGIASVFFAIFYDISSDRMMFDDCPAMLKEANRRLDFCAQAIVTINSAIEGMDHSVFSANFTFQNKT